MIEILEARIAPAVALAELGQLAGNPGAGTHIATDSDGNIIVVGSFTGTVDFDLGPGLTNFDAADATFGSIFVAKYSPDFQLLWVKRWGGTGAERANALLVSDETGDIFVAGNFSSTSAGFDGSGGLSASVNSPQAFVFKMNPLDGTAATAFDNDGQLSFGNGSSLATANALALDSNGRLLFGGEFIGTGVGVNGTGPLSATTNDGYAFMVSSTTGAVITPFGTAGGVQFFFTPQSLDSIFKLQFDSSGNVFIGLTSFEPSSSQTFSQVDKYLSNGQHDSSFGTVALPGAQGVTDFAILPSGAVLAATILGNPGEAGSVNVFRFDSVGDLDQNFGFLLPNGQRTGAAFINVSAKSASLLVDGDRFYVAGSGDTSNYLARITAFGDADTSFAKSGVTKFGSPTSPGSPLAIAVDPSGKIILRDFYKGNPDLDPGAAIKKLAARPEFAGRADMSDGFLIKIDPAATIAGQPLILEGGINEGNGLVSQIFITLTGPGRVEVKEKAGGGQGDIESIELFDTTLASKLTIVVKNLASQMIVDRIFTHDSLQHVGSIIIDRGYTLGNGQADTTPDLLVTGKIQNLTLGQVEAHAIIRLGRDLPYNLPDSTTPDTYNHKPNLFMGRVIGPGVVVDNAGDGTAGGIGGGGFGKVVVERWEFDGVLKTTQSIDSFTVLFGNFFANLEVDKLNHGEGTTANVGSMTVQDGDWGSSGTDIEGNVGVFNVDEFLAGAAIEAGSIGKINTADGFNGTLTLTDGQASATATFTVNANFTGKVISEAPLKKLNIKGDFKGSLTAPSIAAITAFSFIGTTVDDGDTNPTQLNITTTNGLLGLLWAKSGTFKDYVVSAAGNLTGMKVVLSKLTEPTAAMENLNVSAANIGPLTVALAGKTTALGLNLTGIQNSEFTTPGKQGNIAVKLSGASGHSAGTNNVEFNAGVFGNLLVSVAKGKVLTATGQGLLDTEFESLGDIGAVTVLGDASMAQASGLHLWANGKIGPVTIRSKTASFATLENGSILAGQLFDIDGLLSLAELKARLVSGGLGPINVAGSIVGSTIAAGGQLGVLNVGGSLSQSLVLAGATLGPDRVLGGGNDFYHRAGQIGAVTVKGSFDKSSLSAGIDPTDGIFGNGDDVLGVPLTGFDLVAAIKSVKVGVGVIPESEIAMAHSYAIQARALGKLTVGTTSLTDFSAPQLLDLEPNGEGAEDVIVRIL